MTFYDKRRVLSGKKKGIRHDVDAAALGFKYLRGVGYKADIVHGDFEPLPGVAEVHALYGCRGQFSFNIPADNVVITVLDWTEPGVFQGFRVAENYDSSFRKQRTVFRKGYYFQIIFTGNDRIGSVPAEYAPCGNSERVVSDTVPVALFIGCCGVMDQSVIPCRPGVNHVFFIHKVHTGIPYPGKEGGADGFSGVFTVHRQPAPCVDKNAGERLGWGFCQGNRNGLRCGMADKESGDTRKRDGPCHGYSVELA